MVSQQPNDIHAPEEETPPSHDQKQSSAPTSSLRSRSHWLRVLSSCLRILGMVLAVAGVYVVGAVLYMVGGVFGYMYILPLILLGFVSACLIQSSTGYFMVPVLFSVGCFLNPGFARGDSTTANVLYVLVFLVFVEIGVAIGTPIGKLIEKRLRH